jgi:hypothetical protein
VEAGEKDSLLRRSRAAPTRVAIRGALPDFDQTVDAERALIRNVRAMDLQATLCGKRHDIQGCLAVVVNRKGQSPSQCCTALR